MTCLELPVVLWVAIMQGQLEIMQQCMHTHELDYYAASALPLYSISRRILCCPFQHWQCMHRTTKMALGGWKDPWTAKLESLLLAHAEVTDEWLLQVVGNFHRCLATSKLRRHLTILHPQCKILPRHHRVFLDPSKKHHLSQHHWQEARLFLVTCKEHRHISGTFQAFSYVSS
jgi:hypothetical protein